MTTIIPSGYTARPKPKSIEEAISQHANERLKSIAKNALHSYIQSFMDTEGVNRTLISAAAPSGLQYITDRSFDPDSDRTKRHVQLARFYNEIRQQIPAILIIDGGMTWIPSSMGSIEKATLVNGTWQGWFTVQANVMTTTAIITADQETTDLLQNVLLLLFGPLRNTAGGSRIFSPIPGDNWEVRIPLVITPGTNNQTLITEDTKDSYWAASIDMELAVESTFMIEQDINSYEETKEWTGNPVIYAPDTVTVNELINLRVDQLEDQQRIILSDPNIATIDVNSLIITPRRTGTFKVQIIDLRVHEEDTDTAKSAHKVVAEHDIIVTL